MAGEGRKEAMDFIAAVSADIDEMNAGEPTESGSTAVRPLRKKGNQVLLTPEELEKQEAIGGAEYNVGTLDTPEDPKEQKEAEKAEAKAKLDSAKAEAARQREQQKAQEKVDQGLARESERRVKAEEKQAAAEEKRRKGMEALQKQEAKLAEKQRHKATVEAARHGLPGPLGLVAEAAHGPYEMLSNTASDVKQDLEKVSTPGSILLPVLIVIVLFLAVMPVNGYPRLAWLWFVITGNASLTGAGPGTMAASEIAPLPPQTPEQQEQASWNAHRQQVAYHSFTGMEDGDF